MLIPRAALLALTAAIAQPAWGAVISAERVDLQAAVDRAVAGDVIEVPAGTWRGPVVITTARLTLRGEGPSRSILDGGGRGTVLRLDAPGVIVEGLHVRGSGEDLAGPDSCVFLTRRAEGAAVRGNRMSACAFGIWVNETRRAELRGNRIVGSTEGHRSNRGNGIQLFDGDELLVIGNEVSGGRDGIYVSATENSQIVDNLAHGTRYGVHYMYAYRNTLRGNVCRNNGSGFALMGSQHLVVVGNRAEDNEHHGLLFRDVQYSRIEGNVLVGNGEGLFFYSSTENRVAGNRILRNEVGAKVWGGSLRNQITGNLFVGNRQQVFYVASSDLEWGVDELGNIWGDYLGWDQDGDGAGDRPYRVDSFTSNLIHRYPAAVLLLRSPALEMLAHLQERMPLLRAPTVIDRRPMMAVAPGRGR